MKKTLRKSLLLCLSTVFFFVLSVFFVSCGKDTKSFTMTFVTNGGTEIAPITAEAGADITPPVDPEKADSVFEGWYLHEDFSGKKQSIPAKMPEENVTYYAKFTDLQKATLTLDATEYGSLSTTQYSVVVGTNVQEFVESIAPQGNGDAQFACWYDGYQALSPTKKMPSKGLTLTAKYTVSYEVEVYQQNANDDLYTLDDDANLVEGDLSGFVGDTVDYSDDWDFKNAYTGFILNTASTNSITLGTQSSQNVYKAYFNRKKLSVTFLENTPSGAGTATGTVEVQQVKLGATVVVPEEKYALEGYRFAGWTTSAATAVEGDTFYHAGDTLVVEDADRGLILYAQWNSAVVDAYDENGDTIYLLKETFNTETKTGKALLVRDGLGEKEISYRLNETTGRKEFSFETTDETQISGRISADGTTFAYLRTGDLYNATLVQYDYTTGKTDSSTLFEVDGIDGAKYTYTKEGASEPTVVTGVYTLYNASSSEYVFVPDADFLSAGETGFYFRLGTLSDTPKTKVFQKRDGYYGVYYATTATQTNPYPFYYFDGYGTAYKYTSSTSGTEGTYELVENKDFTFEYEDANGNAASVLLRLSSSYYAECDAVKGEYAYEFNGKNVTVTLDGFGKAVYAVEGSTDENTSYTISSTYSLNGVEYAYVTYKTYVLRIDLTEGGAGTTLIASDKQYGSIAEAAAKNAYGATLFFLGDDNVTVYINVKYSFMGYEFTRSYPFATGTYTENEDDGSYTLNLAQYFAFGDYTAEQAEQLLSPYYNGVKLKIDVSGSSKYFVTSDGFGEKKVTFTYGNTAFSAQFDGFGLAATTGTATDGTTAEQTYTYTYLSGMDYTKDGKNYTFVNFAGVYLRLTAGEEAADVVNFLSDFRNRLTTETVLMVFSAGGDADIVVQNADATGLEVKAGGTYATTDATNGVYTFTSSESAPYDTFKFKVNTSLNVFLTYKAGEEYKIEGEDRYLTDGYGIFNTRYFYEIDGEWVNVYSVSSSSSSSSSNTISLAAQYKIAGDVIALPDAYANTTYYSYELVEGEVQFGKTGIILDGYGVATKKATSGDTTGTYVVGDDGIITATFGAEAIKFKTGTRVYSSSTYAVYIPENTAWETSYKCGENTYTVDKYGETLYETDGASYRAYFVIGNDALFAERKLAYMYVYNEAGTSIQGYLRFILTEAGGEKTLEQVTADYGTRYLSKDGRVDLSYALLYDGLGNVYYKTPDGMEKGKAEATENSGEYRFVPDDTEKLGFVFTVDTVSDYTVFKTYAETYDCVSVAGDWRTLTTDGYGNATLVGKLGTKIALSYRVVKEDVLFLYNTSGYRYYFTLDKTNGAFAETEEEFILDGATLLAYTGTKTEITLPAAVTEIATDAFYANFYLQTVHLNNVKKIGSYAFYACVFLQTIDLENVEEIGAYAFGSCMMLKEIDLTSTTSLGAYAFASCSALSTVAIPAGVTEIPTGAFYGCAKLATVTNTEHVKKVGAYAFYGCTALTGATFGEALTEIGSYAFASCATAEGATFVLVLNGATAPTFGTSVFDDSGDDGCRVMVKDMATLQAWLAKDVALGTYLNYLYVESTELGFFEFMETAEGEEEAKRTALMYLGANSRAAFVTLDGNKVFWYKVGAEGTITFYAYSSEEDCGYVAYTGTLSGDTLTVEIEGKTYTMTKVVEDGATDGDANPGEGEGEAA